MDVLVNTDPDLGTIAWVRRTSGLLSGSEKRSLIKHSYVARRT